MTETRWAWLKRRGSFYNTDLPHHRIDYEDDTGLRTISRCKCGFRPYGYSFLCSPLEAHIIANDDHKCHYRRYGYECTRVAGHRGIHRQ